MALPGSFRDSPYHRRVTETVRVEAFGRAVSIHLPTAEVHRRTAAQWARCLPTSRLDEPALPDLPAVEYVADADPDEAAYLVTSRVTLGFIGARAGDLIMLHAAGIADPATGDALALVAPSGTGKTTAARTLSATDFGYLSDETVAVTAARRVLPYPKPLSVVVQGRTHKRQFGPDELGLLPAPAMATLRRIVILERSGDRTDSASGRLERVPLLDGILTLIPQLSYLTRMTDPLAAIVQLVVDCGGVHRLHYAEIEGVAGTLRDLLSTPTQEPADVAHLSSGDGTTAPGPGTVTRAAYADAVRIDDEVLLLVGDRPVRCSGLGATVWSACDRPRTPAELLATCVAEHGDHPQAQQLVRSAVADLARHGVLLTG